MKTQICKKNFRTALLFFLFHMAGYAQGPNAPEAGSFEPVDATDMVNLVTGDFTYVLPLLNVPSPEGGYPIALSYHAGIAMDQEASWVGLGWNVNPGAINRGVNGYPDDWESAETSTVLFDNGGESNYFSVGISYAIGEVTSIGARYSYHENRSLNGGESSYRHDFDLTGSTMFSEMLGVTGSIGTSGASLGISLTYLGENNSIKPYLSLNIHQSFLDGKTSFSGGMGLSGRLSHFYSASLGVSISSKNGLSVTTTQPISLTGSKNDTELSIKANGYRFFIPIGPMTNIMLNFGKTRYWLFDQQINRVYGSLYQGKFSEEYTSVPFKYLVLNDATESIYKFDFENQIEENNLSIIAKDNYRVSGQGIGGVIGPDFYEASTLIMKSKLAAVNVIFEGINSLSNKNISDENDGTDTDVINDLYFYFKNSASSYLNVNSGDFDIPYSIDNIDALIFSEQNLEHQVEIDGLVHDTFNNKNRKRDGRYVEVFTNKEILNNNQKVIRPQNSLGFSRENCPSNGIGAYKITTLDGKTYHYSLPVYQKEKFTKTTNETDHFELKFLERVNFSPYATHWLLTAITGPDYFDVNENDLLDENDYGYWVSFEHGKWSDGIAWTGPVKQDLRKNVEPVSYKSNGSKSYSWGLKESYYLNKIKTRTHSALFIKDTTSIGKSPSINFVSDKPYKNETRYQKYLITDSGKYIFGFYNPKYNLNNYKYSYCFPFKGKYTYEQNIHVNSQYKLKLDKIILLKNTDVPDDLANQSTASKITAGSLKLKKIDTYIMLCQNYNYYDEETPPVIDIDKNWDGQFYDNIIDVTDFNSNNVDMVAKAVKIVKFKSDNSLTSDKLILNNVTVANKAGIQLLPSYKFDYINDWISYDYDKMDDWGYHRTHPSLWSLDEISTPLGTKLKIRYESDDYHKEVLNPTYIFSKGLQFVFSEHDGNLRITVENESDVSHPLDFTKYFQQGSSTSADIWVCLRHDFWQWGCKGRTGKIDIKRNDIDVVSVTSNQLILETDLSVTSSDNGGLGMLYGKVIGEKIHPGILVNKERGQCAEPPGCINVSKRLVFQYSLNNNKILYDQDGGGIRVKQLELTHGSEHYFTNYYYNIYGSNKIKGTEDYISSGMTSYTPSKYFKEIKYLNELPPPGVFYKNVTVENTDNEGGSEFRTIYTFNTFNPSVIDNDENFSLKGLLNVETSNTKNGNIYIDGKSKTAKYKLYKVFKNYASLGQLLSIKKVNSRGHLLSTINNKYKSIDEIKQGWHQETFNTIKNIVEQDTLLITTTSRMNYPSVLQSTTTTVGGHTKTQYFDKYDFLTGQVLETRIDASDGTKIKTQKIPARTIAAYSNDEDGFGMGSKADNPTHKNMLSQQAATYAYLFDEETQQWDVLNVDVTTWNNQWDYTGEVASSDEDSPHNIWRKHQTYVWEGTLNENGTYKDFDVENDAAFQWGVGASQTNPVWKKTSETTLYNHYSVPLEVQDVNGNKAANKMGDGDSKVIASANAPYADFFYSGGEYVVKDAEGNPTDYFDGDVGIADGIRFNYYGAKHTGNLPVTLYPNKKTFVVKPGTSGNYKASVWAYHRPDAVTFPTEYAHITLRVGDDDINFNASEVVRAGDWVLLCFEAAITAGQEVSIVANGNSYATLDDFRLHPVAASMTSYVYNQWDELTHIIGPNGLATEYVYDGAGNLTEVKKEVIANEEEGFEGGFKTVSKHTINYKK